MGARLSSVLGVGISLLVPTSAFATEYYVATTGSDTNPGTIDRPFATLQKGISVAVAGDTVWIRGGTYAPVTGASATAGFTFTKSGQSDTNRIKFWAYPGELPVFDFSNLQLSATQTSAGFLVTGSWLHFKGLEIENVPMPGTRSNNGIWNNGGSNNIFEFLNIHNITGPGLSIANGTGGHLVLNCDSHDNYDPNSDQGAGQNADGFGCHYQTTGPSTIFRGCRAWYNSDDGYDLISQEVPVTIENSWAMGNGLINSGTARPAAGNGNGFKAGSSQTGVRHIIRNDLAWKNVAAGFYANHSSGGNDWFNNTSYMNGTQYNMLASPPGDSATTIVLTGALAHKMRNNIGFPNRNTNMNGVDTMFNSWDLNLVPSNNDFVSVTDTAFMGPRQADGSLPAIDFMRLRAGSQMIDKGTDVGLPFVGSAPDLGAFEFGAVSTGAGGAPGDGGTTGTGGAAGAGGATGSGGARGTGGAAGAAGAGGSGGAGGAGGSSVGTGGTTLDAGSSGGAGGGAGAAGGAGSSGSAGSGAAGSSNVAGSRGDLSPPSASGGCSCKVGRHGSSASSWLLLAGLGLLARRRRR